MTKRLVDPDCNYYSRGGGIYVIAKLMEINDLLFQLPTGGKLYRRIDTLPARQEIAKLIEEVNSQLDELSKADPE
jgi:hypothetical protein